MKVAIDFGSTNTTVAVSDSAHAPVIVPDANRGGAESTPSKVLVSKERAFVGVFAERAASYLPDCRLLGGFKRYLGSEQALLDVGGTSLAAENLTGIVLRKIRSDFELNVSRKLEACVLGVPGSFTSSQRRGLIVAANAVDIEVECMVEDALASAVVFERQGLIAEGDVFGVYGLGGGVFDFALIAYSRRSFHVIAKTGLTDFGGAEFDALFAKQLMNDLQQAAGRASIQGGHAERWLQSAAAKLKESSCQLDQHLTPPEILFVNNELIEFHGDVTAFMTEARKLLDVTHALVSRCIESIGLSKSDLASFFLTGGLAQASFVQGYWREKFAETPLKVKVQHHSSMVAKGVVTASLAVDDQGAGAPAYRVVNCAAYPLGLRNPSSGEFTKLIDANTPYPLSAKASLKIASQVSSSSAVELEICQRMPVTSNFDVIGRVHLAGEALKSEMHIEVAIESAADGEYALRIRSATNGNRLPFEFKLPASRFASGDAYEFTRGVEINAN